MCIRDSPHPVASLRHRVASGHATTDAANPCGPGVRMPTPHLVSGQPFRSRFRLLPRRLRRHDSRTTYPVGCRTWPPEVPRESFRTLRYCCRVFFLRRRRQRTPGQWWRTLAGAPWGARARPCAGRAGARTRQAYELSVRIFPKAFATHLPRVGFFKSR